MFDFFITNHLISANQSGFKTGDSCVNQLLSITNGIRQGNCCNNLATRVIPTTSLPQSVLPHLSSNEPVA